ncbi:JAB domain-containing protein [Flagellimonas sp. 2504JD4-2]
MLLRENKIRRNQEHFWVVGLNTKNKILFIELIGLGAVNRVNADPPDVFRMAIYKLATKVILVHNHPSGVVDASKGDQEFTDRILLSNH